MAPRFVHAMTIRFSDKERKQLEEIAEHEGETRVGDVIRRLIRRRYRALFSPTTSKISLSMPRGSVG